MSKLIYTCTYIMSNSLIDYILLNHVFIVKRINKSLLIKVVIYKVINYHYTIDSNIVTEKIYKYKKYNLSYFILLIFIFIFLK